MEELSKKIEDLESKKREKESHLRINEEIKKQGEE